MWQAWIVHVSWQAHGLSSTLFDLAGPYMTYYFDQKTKPPAGPDDASHDGGDKDKPTNYGAGPVSS